MASYGPLGTLFRRLVTPPGWTPKEDFQMALDETKLNAFVNKAVGDVGATMSSILVVIGDRLGLWKAMAKDGPLTASELAKRTETAERYIREWLDAQASAGYVSYD